MSHKNFPHYRLYLLPIIYALQLLEQHFLAILCRCSSVQKTTHSLVSIEGSWETKCPLQGREVLQTHFCFLFHSTFDAHFWSALHLEASQPSLHSQFFHRTSLLPCQRWKMALGDLWLWALIPLLLMVLYGWMSFLFVGSCGRLHDALRLYICTLSNWVEVRHDYHALSLLCVGSLDIFRVSGTHFLPITPLHSTEVLQTSSSKQGALQYLIILSFEDSATYSLMVKCTNITHQPVWGVLQLRAINNKFLCFGPH